MRDHEEYVKLIIDAQRILAAMRPDYSLFGGRPSPRRIFLTYANLPPSATYPLLQGTNWGYTLELTSILLGECWRPHFDCFFVNDTNIDPLVFDIDVPESDHLDRARIPSGTNAKDIQHTYIRLDAKEIRVELFACADKRSLGFQNVLWNEHQLKIAQALLEMIEDRALHPHVVNNKIIPALRCLPYEFEAGFIAAFRQSHNQNLRGASPQL